MPFLTGRVTCLRFRVSGKPPRSFGADDLGKLSNNAIGKQRVQSGDGSQSGWIAGDHILDTEFDLAKNVVNDALHVSMRVDEQKIPSDLYRAYYQVELQALTAGNPSGNPSGKQKRQAREYAKDRLENEARDGRYLRRKAIPVLWDAPSNELMVGTTSSSALDRLVTLFHHTFERKFDLLGAGRQAFAHAEATSRARAIDDAKLTGFTPGGQVSETAWMPDETNRDFLGNEFLLWLWFALETESDTIKLSDDSEVTAMIARSLLLECPRGQSGRESISSDGPAKLPEAHRAIQAGKLRRKMGLTLVRQDSQYELTLQAETLAIGSARLPQVEADDDHARREERVTQVRHLLETVDLLYAAFLDRRLSNDWTKVAGQMKKWLRVAS